MDTNEQGDCDMKQPMDHYEPERMKIADLTVVRKIGGLLRNVFLGEHEKDGGETPTITENGSEEEHNAYVADIIRRMGPYPSGAPEWEPNDWHYSLHAGCGEICPVMATVPYDPDCGKPSKCTALAIAQAGGLILDLAAEVERLRELLDEQSIARTEGRR